jgi:hypothetical protein
VGAAVFIALAVLARLAFGHTPAEAAAESKAAASAETQGELALASTAE